VLVRVRLLTRSILSTGPRRSPRATALSETTFVPATCRPCRPGDVEAIVSLWTLCGLTRPWNDPSQDIDRKLSVDADGLLVLEDDARLIGTVMVGYEGHRGWINYLAVHPAHRRRGLGRLLMAAAEQRLTELGCPKVNLQVRGSNTEALAFYGRIGYIVDDVVSMGKRLDDIGSVRSLDDMNE
jgi:ribosomal protein S18 acetylase RimI-like enzyme